MGTLKGSLDARKLSSPHCAVLASVNSAAGGLGRLKCSSRHRTTRVVGGSATEEIPHAAMDGTSQAHPAILQSTITTQVK